MYIYGDKLFSYWRCFYSEINKKNHTCCDLGLCLLLRQPCYPPFDGPVALRPTLTGCLPFFRMIFWVPHFGDTQALTITYAIVAPGPIEKLKKSRFTAAPPWHKKPAGGKLLFRAVDNFGHLIHRKSDKNCRRQIRNVKNPA